jgi:uncharacterized protein
MPPFVAERIDEIRALCERYGVRRLDLFGSATTDRFDPETSDLDFLVDFADRSPGYAIRYLRVAEGLEAIFGRSVDLVTERSVQDPLFRRSVESSRRAVYDRGDETSAA